MPKRSLSSATTKLWCSLRPLGARKETIGRRSCRGRRVLVRQRAAVVAAHGDLEVRTRGGVVPEGERAVAVEQLRDRIGVGDHPGDVGGGRERADPERAVGVADQLPRQPVAVDAAVGVLGDAHHVGDRLAPEQLVGVVLVGSDEHHRPRPPREGRRDPEPPGRPGEHLEAEDPHQLVDRAGGAGAGEDHRVLVGASDRLADDRRGPPRGAGSSACPSPTTRCGCWRRRAARPRR